MSLQEKLGCVGLAKLGGWDLKTSLVKEPCKKELLMSKCLRFQSFKEQERVWGELFIVL